MEFPVLICKGKNNNDKIYKLSIRQNDENNDNIIKVVSEYGLKGCHLKKNEKIYKNFKINKKKGILNLSDYVIDICQKLYMKKKKEGYIELNNEKNKNQALKNEKKEINKNKDNKNNDDKNNDDKNNDDKNNDDKNNDDNNKNNDKHKTYSIRNNKNNDNKNNDINKTYSIRKYSPMLAYDFKKKSSYIIYPCNVQPKLDGIRAIAVKNNLYSRNGLLFPTLEHIKSELLKSNLILDGELYTDDINFEKIVGLVRKSTKTKEEENLSLKIYYNVFDIVDKTLTFKERYSILKNFIEKNSFKYIKLVKTEVCNKKEEIDNFLNKYIKEGYEGLIIRNIKGKYEEGLRSSNLIKLKKFKDEEFKIVDYTCPKIGKEVGCVIWICSTKEGKIFNVRPEGGYPERKKLYRNGKKYIGKMLTVKYQEMTNDNIPRFPVGVGIRDYE